MFSANTKDAANETIADAKTAAFSAKRDLRDASNGVRSEITEYAEKAGREVRHLIDATGNQLHDAGDRVTGEIRSNPVRSSAIALGIGFVIGALVRR